MKRTRTMLVTWVALLVAAGPAAAREPKLLPLPPERIRMNGYSLVPPDEPGWAMLRRERRGVHTLALGRGDGSAEESYAIVAMLIKTKGYRGPEEFLALVREYVAAGPVPARYHVRQVETEARAGKATDCARTHGVVEDFEAAPMFGHQGVVILEVVGFFCAHPDDRRVLVYVGLSQRYHPEHRDTALVEKAERLFASLEFSGL